MQCPKCKKQNLCGCSSCSSQSTISTIKRADLNGDDWTCAYCRQKLNAWYVEEWNMNEAHKEIQILTPLTPKNRWN